MKIEVKRLLRWESLAFPLFLAAATGTGILLWNPLTAVFRDPDRARAWVDSLGPSAPLAFVGLQILQVVIFVIPGEIVQIGGGYVFGFWGSALLSSAGILLGSSLNFYVGRLLGRPFVERFVRGETLARIEKATGSGKEAAGFFLLYVIPGFPKDALSYAAGMGRMSLPLFLAVSGLGRLPGILGSAFMGSQAYKERYGIALITLALASCLFFAGFFYKDRLLEVLHRALRRNDRPDGKNGPGPKPPAP